MLLTNDVDGEGNKAKKKVRKTKLSCIWKIISLVIKHLRTVLISIYKDEVKKRFRKLKNKTMKN